jgi:mono/diheme cytochrome c family protein
MHGGRTVGIGLVALAFGLTVPLVASQAPSPDKPKLVRESARPIASVEGKDLYAAYCASCHGKTGKGDGPAVVALKAPPPDLTLIAKRNGGKFAWAAVEQAISGADRALAHGTPDMPIWGPIFFSMGHDTALETMRLKNLTSYLESMQQK